MKLLSETQTRDATAATLTNTIRLQVVQIENLKNQLKEASLKTAEEKKRGDQLLLGLERVISDLQAMQSRLIVLVSFYVLLYSFLIYIYCID